MQFFLEFFGSQRQARYFKLFCFFDGNILHLLWLLLAFVLFDRFFDLLSLLLGHLFEEVWFGFSLGLLLLLNDDFEWLCLLRLQLFDTFKVVNFVDIELVFLLLCLLLDGFKVSLLKLIHNLFAFIIMCLQDLHMDDIIPANIIKLFRAIFEPVCILIIGNALWGYFHE